MKNFRFVPLFIFLILSSCALLKGQTKVQYPNSVSSEMRAEFDQAEEKFTAKNYDSAEKLFQQYATKFPYNELTDASEYRLGQILMLRKNYSGAVQKFDPLIKKTPDPAVASRARVKAGISEYRLGDFSAALDYFDKTDPQYIGINDQVKMAGLALLAIEKLKAHPERKGFYQAVELDTYQALSDAEFEQKYGSEVSPRQDLVDGLSEWVELPAEVSKLDPRLPNYKAQQSAPYVDYKLGMAYFNVQDKKLARKYLNQLVEKNPNHPLAIKAKPTLAGLGAEPVAPKTQKGKGAHYKIGALLPLSGKYEIYGANTLKGMECATSAKAPCSWLSNIELVVRDDQGDPAIAEKMVEELVNQEKVIAIVGPLSSGSALAAAKKAQALGVAMISLAQKEGIVATGSNIFRFSFTPQEQLRGLLQYTTNKANKKSVAVFYPNSNYGKLFLSKLQEMAPQYGASVAASQSYNPAAQLNSQLRQLKFQVSKKTIDNPIGFDALFIPDSYASVLKILPHLEDAGMDKVLLMGTNAWNDRSLAEKSFGKLDNSVFLDIFFNGSGNPQLKQFVDQFSSAYGHPPSTLEAMGFDAVRFLGQALQSKKPSSPSGVPLALQALKGYHGVTGLRSFLSDRETETDPYLLTIEKGEIKEIH